MSRVGKKTIPIPDGATVMLGGMKESGQGREGSKYSLDSYQEIKYICVAGVDK